MRFAPRLAVAVLASLPLATAGCASGIPAEQSQVQQIGQLLLNAYEASTTVPGVLVSVTQTVQSGVDPVAGAKGWYALWFNRKIGQASLTIQDAAGSTSLVAVRDGYSFYMAPTQGKLAGDRVDLNGIGQRAPGSLPQIQSPWIDPFQLTTLLGSVQWPDSIHSLGPVVVTESAGRHVEYQVTVDTTELARHESGADRDWLAAMGREPRGRLVTLDVTLQNGQISTVSASAPVPAMPLPVVARGKRARSSAAMRTPPPASVVITAAFRYGKPVPAVNQP